MHGRILSKKEFECRFNLYKQGMNDHKIAKKIDISHQSVQTWRNRNNLSANTKGGQKLPKDEEKYRCILYNKRLDDSEIAEKLGMSRSGIKNWRKRQGLPPNKLSGGQEIQINLTPSWELGYLVGLVVGDGYIYERKKEHSILRFESTLPEFINHVGKVLKNLFPQLSIVHSSSYQDSNIFGRIYLNKKHYRITLSSKQVYNFLVQYKQKGDRWSVPFNQSEAFQLGFIGGVIDAEGTVTKYLVRIVNMHKQNLEQVKRLLRQLGFIYGKISIREIKTESRCGKAYCLEVMGNKNLKLILDKAKIPYRFKKLKKALNEVIFKYSEENYFEVMQLRKETGWSAQKIAKKIGLPMGVTASWLYSGVKPLSLGLAKKYGDSFQNE